MKKRSIAAVFCFGLTLCILLSFTGCARKAHSADLMAGIKAGLVTDDIDLSGYEADAIAGFAVSLFQSSLSPADNILISPVSVLCALAMTSNGANEETLSQMEDVFGLTISELNAYLGTYLKRLPTGEKYKASIANSIWFKDDLSLTIKNDFLQTNAEYYGASIYKAAFDDATLKDINDWVDTNTDGMIKNIIDSIPDAAIMYLINALAFDAEWEEIYNTYQVQDGIFTTEAGVKRDTKMMYCSEYAYLDDGMATGFIKYYADRKYAFAALLPNEGITVADYAADMTGEGLMETLGNPQRVEVYTGIPKFESEYSIEMSEILEDMGMTEAFSQTEADFKGLGEIKNGNICINRVIHKTFIALDEKGTKAGAATAVEMVGSAAVYDPEEPKIVYLDRPFVYMLIDCETNLPMFIGIMMDTGE